MLFVGADGVGHGTLDELLAMRNLVKEQNACALPGCTIKYDTFVPCMWRAVDRGYVKRVYAEYVADGLRNGFSLGLDPGAFLGLGKRVFTNYPSAEAGRDCVTEAIGARVDKGKTLVLGTWGQVREDLQTLGVSDYFVFPMGAVSKPHEPWVLRPTSDHTRTGFNAAPLHALLQHSLNIYPEVAALLKKGYFMYVSDITDAFLLIPLAPWLWFFFLFRAYRRRGDTASTTFVHLFGDFGTRFLPGTFYIFIVKVVIPMARSELVVSYYNKTI